MRQYWALKRPYKIFFKNNLSWKSAHYELIKKNSLFALGNVEIKGLYLHSLWERGKVFESFVMLVNIGYPDKNKFKNKRKKICKLRIKVLIFAAA